MIILSGAGIHVFRGIPTGSFINNSLVSLKYNDMTRLQLFCRSDSMMAGVGTLLGIDGNPIVAPSNRLFEVSNTQPGELRVENLESKSTNLTASKQGVYTCRILLQSGETREINIGIYPSGFTSELWPLTIT